MICQDLDQLLYPYLDGEFEGTERREVEDHLMTCPACEAKVTSEANLQEALRAKVRSTVAPAPDALKRRVAAGFLAERRRVQTVSWLVWGSGALVAAAVGFGYLHLRPPRNSRFLEDAALRHARRLPYEVQAPDAARVEAWFDGKLPYRVPVPRLAHTTLAGARLSNVRDREAAYIGYDTQLDELEPRRVGVFVMDDADDELSAAAWPAVEIHEAHGWRVAVWRSGGIVYELVSDLDEPRIRQMFADQEIPPQSAVVPAPAPASLDVIPALLQP